MQKTLSRRTPWHLIPADDKPYGRLAALRIMTDRLAKNVSLDPRPLEVASVQRVSLERYPNGLNRLGDSRIS